MTAAPRIGPNERLSATLVLATVLMGVVILGINFAREAAAPVTPTLDVILTQTMTEQPPDQADFIAQANNQGGGDQDKVQRPRDDKLARVPQPDPGIAPETQVAQAPPAEPKAVMRVLTNTRPTDQVVPIPEDQRSQEAMPLPTGQELIQQSLEIARLSAEIDRQQQLYAKRPRRKFISASTQEYVYASYLRAWVAKVERVGNLNYPDEARRRSLFGRLVMTVAVRRDGSVEDITLNEPSGEPLLDQAAIRTVHLAEPFPPLPVTEDDIDRLHITRTWEFSPGGVSSGE